MRPAIKASILALALVSCSIPPPQPIEYPELRHRQARKIRPPDARPDNPKRDPAQARIDEIGDGLRGLRDRLDTE